MNEDDEKIVEDSDADTKDDIESEQNDMETEVEDTDADTRDIERTSSADFAALMDRMGILEKMVSELSGSITALRDAQAVMIENGAVVNDSTEVDGPDDFDDFRSISELDLSL